MFYVFIVTVRGLAALVVAISWFGGEVFDWLEMVAWRAIGWDEVYVEGLCGVSLFLQARDGRVGNEDQGLVAKDGDEQQ